MLTSTPIASDSSSGENKKITRRDHRSAMTSGSLDDRGLGGSRTWRKPVSESLRWWAYCVSLQMNVIVAQVSKVVGLRQSGKEAAPRRAKGHGFAQARDEVPRVSKMGMGTIGRPTDCSVVYDVAQHSNHCGAEGTNPEAENDSPFPHGESRPLHVTDGAEPCGSTAI